MKLVALVAAWVVFEFANAQAFSAVHETEIGSVPFSERVFVSHLSPNIVTVCTFGEPLQIDLIDGDSRRQPNDLHFVAGVQVENCGRFVGDARFKFFFWGELSDRYGGHVCDIVGWSLPTVLDHQSKYRNLAYFEFWSKERAHADKGSRSAHFRFAGANGRLYLSPTLNGVLNLKRSEQEQTNDACEREPNRKQLTSAVPRSNGPSDTYPGSENREPQLSESHPLAPHNLLTLVICVFLGGAGFGGLWGVLLGLRLNVLKSDNLSANCNKGRQHERG